MSLTKIPSEQIKVGDIVGVVFAVKVGFATNYKHYKIYPMKIIRITPKRTKFVALSGDEFDRNTDFYLLDEEAENENNLAVAAEDFIKYNDAAEMWLRQNGFNKIPDKNISAISEKMKEIYELMSKGI